MSTRIELPKGFKSEIDEVNGPINTPWIVLDKWRTLKQKFEVLNHQRNKNFPDIEAAINEAYEQGGYRPK